MAGLAVSAETGRERLYSALLRRNRIVGVLRLAVPAAGVLLLVVVLAGIVLDNLREQFGFSSIRIDRDNLVVDTPTVTGTDGSGALYSATARMAKVRLGTTDVVDMVDAEFTMTPLTGAVFTALAPSGVLQLAQQTIAVPGTLTVSSADGMRGTLDDFFGDIATWWLEAHGAVDLTFPSGMRVQSEGMTYDGNVRLWTFERVTVTLDQTPGAAP